MTNLTLPAIAADILNGKSNAVEIAESMIVAYWMHGRDDGTALYHLKAVHDQFRELATALGYAVAPIANPAQTAAADLYAALKPFADIGVGENPDYQPMIRMDRDAILAARAAIAAYEAAR